ncbi:hypothetical protein AGMMS49991_02870 [Spirochaetia bacterium]|nr:hypothetical protein AGMMS49991_02870 [Spirochaetia bacterium]
MTEGLDEMTVPEIDYMIYRECTPTWNIGRSAFPAWDITYLLKGAAEYIINGVKHDLEAGDLLCMPKGCIRQAHTYPDRLMSCYAVNFFLKNAQGEDGALPFPLVSHIERKKDLLHHFEELSFAWTEQQPGYLLKSRALLMLILHRLFELIVCKVDSSVEDFRIKRVTRYIMQHYAEKLSVTAMADMLGLNPVYFGALFKKETGMTMNRYTLKTRIRNAENLLRSGDYRISAVAKRCGYNDVFYFYKQFKEIMGIPPSQCIPKRNTLGRD